MHIRGPQCVICSLSAENGHHMQIQDLEDAVYAGLLRRAADASVSVPEFLRLEAVRVTAQPSVTEWLVGTARRPSPTDSVGLLAALDELREA